ncbi:MAG: histidine kinase, partial [Chloroflexi bacterium]|nr:histidine kinase [Chloroflexota bacterium]
SSLFRLVQEAINNILKHARATEAGIELRKTDETINGNISDNGTGFDLARLAPGANTGLLGMQERVNLMGGKMEIKTAPGEGTFIQFQVPLRESHGE